VMQTSRPGGVHTSSGRERTWVDGVTCCLEGTYHLRPARPYQIDISHSGGTPENHRMQRRIYEGRKVPGRAGRLDGLTRPLKLCRSDQSSQEETQFRALGSRARSRAGSPTRQGVLFRYSQPEIPVLT